MSQYDFGTIDPETTSGTALASLIGSFRDAINSCHKGSSRPSYASEGMLWVKDSANPWVLYFWNGTEDIPLAAFNSTTHELSIYGVTPRTMEEVVSGSPKTTFIITGGYRPGSMAVYQNGLRLRPSEFTATNGTSVVLDVTAAVTDEMLFEWYD